MTIDRSVHTPAGDRILLAFAGVGALQRRPRLLAL
jgi:hypothetical protein